MLAKKLPLVDSEDPPQPTHGGLSRRSEPVAARTHLLLVPAPSPTPRGLAWARHGGAPALDAAGLISMLRLERLNLG
jgi:hypothetical protein